MYQEIESCRVCKERELLDFFDLGKHPPTNALLKSPSQKEKYYPLSLSFCKKCSLVQLKQTVDPKELFSSYVWVTGTSKIAQNFSKEFSLQVLKRVEAEKGDFVLEVGSNDGTFLKPFINRGFKVLGIDPARNIANLASKVGIPTKALFFSSKVARDILKEKGQAKIIIARNVVYHVADTRGFVEGLYLCLSDNGVLVVEVDYAANILEDLRYDSVYHEHLCYFTLKSLERLFSEFDLHIFDVGISPINVGGLIVYARKRKGLVSKRLKGLRKRETRKKVNQFSSWKNFAKKAYKHKEKLVNMLGVAKKKGVIVGYGASARSSTMLNFCGVDRKIITAIADDNPLKQGLYTAGSHILIDSPEKVMRKEPFFVFILAWNFANEITEKLKDKFGYNGGYIIPIPKEPYIKKV